MASDSADLRRKTRINEDANQPAFWSAFPELPHIEIVAWENGYRRGHLSAVLLRSQDAAGVDESRARFTAAHLCEKGVPVIEADALGGSSLERVPRLLRLEDFVSAYLAYAAGWIPPRSLGSTQ